MDGGGALRIGGFGGGPRRKIVISCLVVCWKMKEKKYEEIKGDICALWTIHLYLRTRVKAKESLEQLLLGFH